MFSNQVRQRVRGLVAGIGPSIVSNPAQVEAKLADLAAANAEDVKLIVSAAHAGIPEEIASAPLEHRAELAEQAATWMASETGTSPEAAKWAVETWAAALEGVKIEPKPEPAAQPQPATLAPLPIVQPSAAYGAGAPPAPWDAPRPAAQPAGQPWGAPPPPPSPGYGQPLAYGQPVGNSYALGHAGNPVDPRLYGSQQPGTASSDSPARLVLAIVLSLVIGSIGSVLIMEMLIAVHFTVGYLYILLGAVVGFSLCKIAGVGGSEMMGAIACGVLLASSLVGHFVFTAQIASRDGVPVSDAISHIGTLLSPFHWILVAISFYACWATVQRQTASSSF